MATSRARFTSLAGTGLAIALLVGLTACGGPPKWVQQGSGAFNEKDSKAFYGVGSVVGVRNEPLAWDTAENRARAEIAKTFETYTGYLMRDYAASTTAGDLQRTRKSRTSSGRSKPLRPRPSAVFAPSTGTRMKRPIHTTSSPS